MRIRATISQISGFLVHIVLALVFIVISFPGVLEAQAVPDPNEIFGTIEFSNTNPEILGILAEPLNGFVTTRVIARSVGVSPLVESTFTGPSEMPTHTSYELTVEAGSGISYEMWAEMSLDSEDETYYFRRVISPVVERPPAPGVEVDLSECVGILDIRWETAAGSPVAVDGGSISVWEELPPSSMRVQARRQSIRMGSTHEYLTVRGDGSQLLLSVFFEIGTDPFSDRITFLHESFVEVDCDEIIEVAAVVPAESSSLGKIVGQVDVLGEEELRTSDLTQIQAWAGPFQNRRYDTIEATPSSGSFELENLVPSDATSPPAGYIVSGRMGLRTGPQHEIFSISSGRIPVAAGETVDLGETFVIDPGFVRGEILLSGPAPGELGSCLANLEQATDTDGDGIPNIQAASHLSASGVDSLANGGYAAVQISGELQTQDFLGNYELVLGGLSGESSIWKLGNFSFRFRNDATPEVPLSYMVGAVGLTDRGAAHLEIVPGESQELDVRHCFGQLNLEVRSATTSFSSPLASFTGELTGGDFEGKTVDHFISGAGFGTPRPSSQTVEEGLVVMCLPEGVYTIIPMIDIINPDGTYLRTELLPIEDVAVECGQVKDISTADRCPCLSIETFEDFARGRIPIQQCVDNGQLTRLFGEEPGTGEAVRAGTDLNGGEPVCGLGRNMGQTVELISVTAAQLEACSGLLRTAATMQGVGCFSSF